jgi:hypothetical protein
MKNIAFVLLVFPLSLLAAEDKATQTPWYPLAVGTAWDYKAGENKFRLEVKAHEKVGEASTARIELIKEGAVLATEHIGLVPQTDGSTQVCRFDLSVKKGDQAITETPKPPILILKVPPKKGDTFTVDSRAGGKVFKGTFKIDEEDVTVPAGSYKKAVKVISQDLEAEGLKPTVTTWYAENVGMVKQVVVEGKETITIELEKFTPGK